MIDPLKPRGSPAWLTALLVVLAVLIIGFGICLVALGDVTF